MRQGLFITIIAALSYMQATAQRSTTTFKVPLSGTTVLRDAVDPFSAQVISYEAPEPDAEGDHEALEIAKERSAAQFPHRRITMPALKGTSVQMPIVGALFVADSFPGIPPDNYIAVNKNQQAVAVMNSRISVRNVATGLMTQRKSLSIFSQSVGLNNTPTNQNNYRYDPKVIYDPEADRFISVMLNGTNEYNYIVVGFSQTNDPTGAWNFYKFYGDYGNDTTWFDYPTIALTHQDFFVSGNKLGYNTSFQTGFKRSVIYQINKADGYAGNALTTQLWDNVNFGGRPLRNLFPVKGGGGLKGPEQYFLSVRNVDVQNDSLFIVKIPDTAGSSNTALTVTAIKMPSTYGIPPNGRQPGTYKVLATNDGRVLGAFIEDGTINFVNAAVSPLSGASGIYHGTVTLASGIATSHLITIDTLDFGYPNISFAGKVSNQNTAIISFNYTGPAAYPGLGAVLYDGIDYSPLLKVKTGDSSITILADTLQRWGDYTGSQPAWDIPGSVWIVGINGRRDHNYGNWMARLQSPIYNAVPSIPKPLITATAYPIPAQRYIRIAFELKEDAILHFTIIDAAGKRVASILDAKCSRGKNELEFNTASLAPATYYLQATGPGNEVLFTKPFIRE